MSEHDYPPNDGQPEPELSPDEPFADERVAALEADIASLNDKILRLAAELENTRRRAEREKQDASRYAIASFARDLLGVADNFERALAAVPEDGEAVGGEAVSSFATGVRMTERALAAALERHGVKRIDPKGEKFDPNLHQAVAQAPAAGVPAGHVAETAQPGFVIGDRVLRAAMVIVSTGEPPAPAEPGAHVDTRV
jgi:molecular chaperone GrpE